MYWHCPHFKREETRGLDSVSNQLRFTPEAAAELELGWHRAHAVRLCCVASGPFIQPYSLGLKPGK